MGNCLADDEAKQQDRDLNAQLALEREHDQQVKKLLLLGPGNSGKSTFVKQLIQIHGKGFTKQQTDDAARNIYDSIIIQMKRIIIVCSELNYQMEEETKKSANYISNLPVDINIDMKEQIGNHIKILWSDTAIKLTFTNRKTLGIVDSCPHFFENIDRISKIDYIPTQQDMLLVRTATTGVTESKFEINKHIFRILDVGGQRSERAKWIHSFDGVTAILFVASLACYDLALYEDADVNAMTETLNLFNDVCNSRWFKRTAMILFLNKSDIFKEKILVKPLTLCFPEYEGENAEKECIEYICNKFVEKNEYKRQRQMYTHVICSIDRDNVERVFNDVQHMVVQASLARGGFVTSY